MKKIQNQSVLDHLHVGIDGFVSILGAEAAVRVLTRTMNHVHHLVPEVGLDKIIQSRRHNEIGRFINSLNFTSTKERAKFESLVRALLALRIQ